jgi:hypothetical protein
MTLDSDGPAASDAEGPFVCVPALGSGGDEVHPMSPAVARTAGSAKRIQGAPRCTVEVCHFARAAIIAALCRF